MNWKCETFFRCHTTSAPPWRAWSLRYALHRRVRIYSSPLCINSITTINAVLRVFNLNFSRTNLLRFCNICKFLGIVALGKKSKSYAGCRKIWHTFFVRQLTSSNIDQFSNLFHCQNQNKICNNNNNITRDPTKHQACHYTTLWNVASVLKVTIDNKMTSVTTHVKSASSSIKADTLNILSWNCRMWQIL